MRCVIHKLACVAALCSVLLGGGPLPAQETIFTNVAPSLGIQHFYSGNFLGGGVSFCDFDGDGRDDLSLSSGAGQLVYLFHNEGSTFNNIAAQMGVQDQFESETILWADYDNDGDKDLFIANYAGSDKLYRHDGNTLTDVTISAGIRTDPWISVAACWADYDNDGWLDLYVVTYSDENGTPKTPNLLYRNLGDGSFAEVGRSAGVNDSLHHPLAVAFLDYDHDGWQDIYIANDKVEGNILYRNLGNATFQDVSQASGANVHMDCMGIAVGDYDENGFLDMYVTNTPAGNGLLRNNGDGTFTNVADSLGIAVNRICWGANFLDFDNDGDLDIYVSTSHGKPDNHNALFESDGLGGFSRVIGGEIAADSSSSYGNAIGDFNDDGFLDIAVLNTTPFTLWENLGNANHWLKVQLVGGVSNRDGVGSWIYLHHGDRRISRFTGCGLSYLSQNSTIETIGTGSATLLDSVVVKWPAGSRSKLINVATDRLIVVHEGQATAVEPRDSRPEEFSLAQNFPNPFNPATRLRYTLKAPAEVQLAVYSLTGQLLEVLFEGRQAAGEYQYLWDAGGSAERQLPSGVYLARLKVGSQSLVRKMVLMR